MRRMSVAVFAGLAAWLSCDTAWAGISVTEKRKTYAIAGKSGRDLLRAMDRHGPKHGLLTRAIAQTSYSVSWTIKWAETSTMCRVKSADGDLAIAYTFPQTAATPSALRRRWSTFLAGVERHEAMHGKLARQMAYAAERAIEGLSVPSDRGCRKARALVKKRLAEVYAAYEARQLRFDAKEHAPGGNVERLIEALSRR